MSARILAVCGLGVDLPVKESRTVGPYTSYKALPKRFDSPKVLPTPRAIDEHCYNLPEPTPEQDSQWQYLGPEPNFNVETGVQQITVLPPPEEVDLASKMGSLMR